MSEDRLLTVREVADRLRYCPETVLRKIREGRLRAIELPGGRKRIRQSDLDAHLAEWTTPGRGGASHPSDAAQNGRYNGLGSGVLAITPLMDAATEDEDA